jgi:group I intron endonuclease
MKQNETYTQIQLTQKRWKGISKIGGIYKIINKTNNKYYIGSSIDILGCSKSCGRLKNHVSDLKNNRHANPHLQNAFNSYGIDDFYFVIIEKFDGNDIGKLLLLEQKYLNLAEKDKSYNINFNAICPPINKGIKHYLYNKHLSNETKNKIRNSIPILKGKQNPWFGCKHSLVTRKILSIKHTGKKLSEIHKNNIKLSAPRGKNHKRHNSKIYRFKNITNGTIFNGTLLEFRQIYEINNVYPLINGKYKYVSDKLGNRWIHQ